MKIAYIGIDLLYSVMCTLLECGCEILEVFTCRTDNKTEFNAKILAMGECLGVPCHIGPIRKEDLERLRENGCEAVFCAAYYHRIPVDTTLPMVNIHPSLLPVGRGAWPMPVTILKGLENGGVTVHKLAPGLDEGDIVLQESFPVSKHENLETFMAKVEAALGHMLPLLVERFEELYDSAVPQGDGEYWVCPGPEDWTVTDDMEPETSDRILRAFYGYECILKTKGDSYELIKGKFVREKPEDGPCFPVRGGYITAWSAVRI